MTATAADIVHVEARVTALESVVLAMKTSSAMAEAHFMSVPEGAEAHSLSLLQIETLLAAIAAALKLFNPPTPAPVPVKPPAAAAQHAAAVAAAAPRTIGETVVGNVAQDLNDLNPFIDHRRG